MDVVVFVDGGCEMIDCGQGKCNASSDSLLGFECDVILVGTSFRLVP